MTSDHSPRQGSGGNRNPRNNNRRRHHRGGRRGGSGRGHGQGQGQGQSQGQHANNNIPQDFQKALSKYENLLEQHLNARRKYFEQYHRVAHDARLRLENVFFKSIEQLREFENRLTDELREQLQDHLDRYDEDSIYTENHNLPVAPAPEEVATKIEDPHVLETQKNANYKDDREESTGTLDDYYSYKGVARPIPDESKEKH